MAPGPRTTFSCNFFINSDCPEIDSLDDDLRDDRNSMEFHQITPFRSNSIRPFKILQGKDLQLWFGCTHVAWVWNPEKWQNLRRKSNHLTLTVHLIGSSCIFSTGCLGEEAVLVVTLGSLWNLWKPTSHFDLWYPYHWRSHHETKFTRYQLVN